MLRAEFGSSIPDEDHRKLPQQYPTSSVPLAQLYGLHNEHTKMSGYFDVT